MEKKICSKCHIEKSTDFFYKNKRKKSGIESNCKECTKIQTKKYRDTHKEQYSKYFQQHWIENKEKIKEYKKKYYQLNKLNIDKKNRIWEKNNKKQYNKRKNERYKERKQKDLLFKLKISLKNRLRKELKKRNFRKDNSFIKYLGCSIPELKIYLEKQFKPEMNWENHYKIWHIDHIIPLSSAKTQEELYKLSHYTNMQPLFASDNLKKGSRIL